MTINYDGASTIKFLTEQEVSILIRKSVNWLRLKRCEGGPDSIPYRKIGKSVRYNEADVLAWIQQRPSQTCTRENGQC
jgi:predicted DNA-binding transcriptional regulator AlpA